jgi:hypothetical protein
MVQPDYNLLFSNSQDLAGESSGVASTNALTISDSASYDRGAGVPIPLFLRIMETFTELTAFTVTLQCSDDSFSTNVALWSKTWVLAKLTAGAKLPIPPLTDTQIPDNTSLRLYYTWTGDAPDAGMITAGIGADESPAGID